MSALATWPEFEAQPTFPCHGCLRLRPDRFIDIYKTTIRVDHRLTLTLNQNYCNDRAECLALVVERVDAVRRKWLDS